MRIMSLKFDFDHKCFRSHLGKFGSSDSPPSIPGWTLIVPRGLACTAAYRVLVISQVEKPEFGIEQHISPRRLFDSQKGVRT